MKKMHANNETVIITEKQIKRLLSRLNKIYKLQQKMSECTNCSKTFALDGRIIGDIGECLASYLFNIRLEIKQMPGHDGLYGKNIPVEIKVRTVSETNNLNHVHISSNSFEQDFYLIFFSIDTTKREIIIKTNAFISGSVLKKVKQARTNKGFITFNKLKSCLDNKMYLRCIKPANERCNRISGWTITYKEGL